MSGQKPVTDRLSLLYYELALVDGRRNMTHLRKLSSAKKRTRAVVEKLSTTSVRRARRSFHPPWCKWTTLSLSLIQTLGLRPGMTLSNGSIVRKRIYRYSALRAMIGKL